MLLFLNFYSICTLLGKALWQPPSFFFVYFISNAMPHRLIVGFSPHNKSSTIAAVAWADYLFLFSFDAAHVILPDQHHAAA